MVLKNEWISRFRSYEENWRIRYRIRNSEKKIREEISGK